MLNIAGFTATGRTMHGPGSNLEELQDSNGFKHTAIVFHPEYRENPAINSGLSIVLNFLESPMVSGLVELAAHDRDEGAFLYPTGSSWSVAEINRKYADMGIVPGIRAGLELMQEVGRILTEAADMGTPQGIECHGGLTPWRITVGPKGQVHVVGYGLPQVEILHFLDHPEANPREDSFRYCPPERLDRKHETLSSDLFALALIGFEFMTGKPVYDGLVNEIRAKASRADSAKRLFKFQGQIPQKVMDVLKNALRREPRDRYQDGPSFLAAIRQALSSPDTGGPSLLDVMEKVVNFQEKPGQMLNPGETHAITPEMRAVLLGGVEPEEPRPVAPSPPPPPRSGPPIGVRSVRRGAVPLSGNTPSAPDEPAPAVTPVKATLANPPQPAEPPPWKSPLSAPTTPASGTGADRPPAWSRPAPRGTPSTLRPESLDRPSLAPGLQPVVSAEGTSPGSASADPLRASTSRLAASLVESIVGDPNGRPRAPRRDGPPPSFGSSTSGPPSLSGSFDRPGPPPPRSTPPPSFASISSDMEPVKRPATSVTLPPIPASLPQGLPPPPSTRSVIPSALPPRVEVPASSPRPPAAEPVTPPVQAPPPPSVRPVEPPRAAPMPPLPESLPSAASVPAPPPTPPASPEPTLRPVSPPSPTLSPSRAPVPSDIAPSAIEGASETESGNLSDATCVRPSPVLRASPESPKAPARPMAAAAGQKQPADAVAPRLGREPNAPSNHWRAPDPIPSEASRGQSAVFVIRRGANGKATRYRLPLQATVTEAIAVLVGTMVPVRTDLSGALQGWWRLCRNGALLPPETRLEALDPETPLDLGFIDNHPLPVELEVKGPQFTMTVRTVVGTAIPAVALVDAAAHMFNLPEGDWRLSVSGRRLGTHDILADHPLEGVARIVLEKA